jgi:membrane protein implicated in regulation of membrane protease activity
MRTLFSPSSSKMFPQPVRGTAIGEINHTQSGQVKYQGTFWTATLYESDCQLTIQPGEPVTIIGIQGINLLVVPANT